MEDWKENIDELKSSLAELIPSSDSNESKKKLKKLNMRKLTILQS